MLNEKSDTCDVMLIGFEDQENLGLRSIAAFLSSRDIRVHIEPYNLHLFNEILESIHSREPEIVGFSLIFQRMLFDFGELISYLRQQGINIHFTMGGHYPSIEYKKTLEQIPGLDTVIRQEGELTLLELYNHLKQRDSWNKIKGLVYRKNGAIVTNPFRPLIKELDTLPYPIRNKNAKMFRDVGMSSILASRGCYYNCSFCSIHEFYHGLKGPKRRARSPANVAQEMDQLFNNKNVRIFIFQDDCIVMKGPKHREWLDNFLNELKRRNMSDQILWRVSCRVDDIGIDQVGRLKDAGLMCLYIGIESGNELGLKTLNKRYTVEDIHHALDTVRGLKMPFEFGFMIFDPDSTLRNVEVNVKFLKEICKDGQVIANFTKMVPYAGTSIARRLEDEGRLEGTIDSPDYTYNDTRVGLLQLFVSQAFNYRNFNINGLVERLRVARFDTFVLSKFHSDKCEIKTYEEAVHELTRQSNESALDIMSMAINFMKNRSESEIIANWILMQDLIHEERTNEARIASELDRVISNINFDLSKG
jgi:radical SAM superfamily enzyme YgiQ (UPF0313 family)